MEILTEFHSNKVERGRAAAAAKERAVRELKGKKRRDVLTQGIDLLLIAERYPAVSPATLEAAYNRLGIHCLNDIVLERGTRLGGGSLL